MQVDLTGRAGKHLRKITNPTQKNKIKNQIKEIESTQSFAFLKTEKLSGHSDRYKIRVGNYRIVIKKISNTHIEVTAIADRKNIYNKLFGITF